MKLTIEQIERMVQEAMKRWQVQKRYRGHAEPEDIERDEAEGMHNIDSLERAQDTAQKKQDIEYAIDAKRRKGVKIKKKPLTKKQRQRKATEKDQIKLPFINEQYSPEQEKKIYYLIDRAREDLLTLEDVAHFFPPLINDVYSVPDSEQAKFDRLVDDKFFRPYIMKHYYALKRMSEILYEINSYLVLLRDLEIEKEELLKAIEEMLNMSLMLGAGRASIQVNLSQALSLMDTGIMFLEDLKATDPKYFGDDINFRGSLSPIMAFEENYNELRKYLKDVRLKLSKQKLQQI